MGFTITAESDQVMMLSISHQELLDTAEDLKERTELAGSPGAKLNWAFHQLS